VRVDDELILSGPYGSFVDDPISTAPALFLAAGSGLAPIRALIEAGLETGARRSVTLMASARSEAEVLDRDRLAGLEARHPQFRFIRTLTRGAGRPRAGIPYPACSVGADPGGPPTGKTGASADAGE
jgi:CDP-4-dehydro-6-deoxyglucose reductase, E3